MCTSASRNWPVGVCALKPERKEAPGPNQLPIEMLREVLSYLPPRTLLRHCRPVCRRWRDLVDAWYLWRSILPWTHPDLWPVIRTCLPPADDPGPCILGRFCERRPIGRNLLRNPRGLGGEPRKEVLLQGEGGRGQTHGALGLREPGGNGSQEKSGSSPEGNPRGDLSLGGWVGKELGHYFHLTGGFQKWTVLSREDDWAEEKENLEVMPRAYMHTSFLSSYR